jgi:hypothetical protein
MTPKQARIMTQAALLRAGAETVTIRRGATTATALAEITEFQPEELVGAIQQGDRKIILFASDLTDAGWPVPPKKNDILVTSQGVMAIQSAALRPLGPAYNIVARGM